jgi:hypothetical protein
MKRVLREVGYLSGAGYDPVVDHYEHCSDCCGSMQCRYSQLSFEELILLILCPILYTFIAVVLL